MFVTGTLKLAPDVRLHNTEPLDGNHSIFSPNNSSGRHCYEIEYERQTESALLLFAHHTVTKEQFVIKMLRPYKDTRYNLDTVSKRQESQLEALRWNSIFTPDFYIGLAPVCEWRRHQKFIIVDEIMRNPTKDILDPNAEYVLIMNQLPDSWRLDSILCVEDRELLECYIQFLTKRVVQMHTDLDSLSIEDGMHWSGFKQLERKLLHNLALANPIFKTIEEDQNNSCNQLKETFRYLKTSLLQVLTDGQYQEYFERRVREQNIKRCHGDLKAPNIWIEPYFWLYSVREPWNNVWILDAIDFNPSYCNIDILSDLAMLVIDIQVRTKSPKLANLMVEDYLECTGQMDNTSNSVLAYYLVEKAFVGSAINFVYKNSPNLGWGYLEVARMRMEDLKRWTTI